MKMEVVNIQNKKVDTIELSDKVFKREWSPALVHQILVAENANQRKPYAAVKDRSEVRGGGRKPWAQKGLGRARHGSIRSPIWTHGGVTHGPRADRDYGKKINKKMKRAAIYAVLSKKAGEGEVKVIDNLDIVKTKDFAELVHKIFGVKTSLLVVPKKKNKSVVRAARNIPKTKVVFPDSLNVSDFLTYKNVLLEKEAVEEIL